MSQVRPAAVAGTFYPADPAALTRMVAGFMGDTQGDGPVPKAVIAPHAGFVYSGALAGRAFRLVAPGRGKIERVVLLGPSHRYAYDGMAATTASAYETPLGRVEVDREWLERARDVAMFGYADEAHLLEHAIETHLPFLQMALGDFKLAPVVCGRASPDQVAALLDTLWGGPETLIAISSDLSHYLDYNACRDVDAKTRDAIASLDQTPLSGQQACGAVPLNGLLKTAARRGMRVETLDLRNSGDTAGPKDRVVGYGAWAFWESAADDDDLVRRHGRLMNQIVRDTITGNAADPGELPTEFREPGACFVTLNRSGRLRGCYGSVTAHRPLIDDLQANAANSAFRDPRFAPLDPSEWDDVTFYATLLTPLKLMTFSDEAALLAQLRPEVDGLVIEDMGRRALFLPSVWESLPSKQEFLAHLKAKAGLPANHWSPGFKAYRFLGVTTLEERLTSPY